MFCVCCDLVFSAPCVCVIGCVVLLCFFMRICVCWRVGVNPCLFDFVFVCLRFTCLCVCVFVC